MFLQKIFLFTLLDAARYRKQQSENWEKNKL